MGWSRFKLEYVVPVCFILIPAGLTVYLALQRRQFGLLGGALVVTLVGMKLFHHGGQRNWKSGGS